MALSLQIGYRLSIEMIGVYVGFDLVEVSKLLFPVVDNQDLELLVALCNTLAA